MKTIIFAVVLAGVSFLASADEAKTNYCARSANLYAMAAQYRDGGIAPEQTLNAASGIKDFQLDEKKRIINQVYFDPAFERAGGAALHSQMLESCLSGPKKHTPLK